MTYGITRKVYDSTSDSFHDIEHELPFGYEWGSNSMVANNAIVMALAYNFTENTDYLNGVVSSMDYLLGRNPLEQAYVTGYGTHHTNWPHHRFWSHGLNSELPYCPDGVLAGGPNSQMQDPMIGGAGYVVGETAPMLCYYDQLEAWSVNECTINWNSPLAYVVSFLCVFFRRVTEIDVAVDELLCSQQRGFRQLFIIARDLYLLAILEHFFK
jgi:endoglucanase